MVKPTMSPTNISIITGKKLYGCLEAAAQQVDEDVEMETAFTRRKVGSNFFVGRANKGITFDPKG